MKVCRAKQQYDTCGGLPIASSNQAGLGPGALLGAFRPLVVVVAAAALETCADSLCFKCRA